MRKGQIVFIAAALLLMALPCVLMPFVRGETGAENRLPAPWPALKDADGWNLDFPSEYEAWLRDHVALRGLWISCYARALRALGTSSEVQVILGRGDWLFFRETLNDYTGVQPLTDAEIDRLALTLDTVDAGLRAQGSCLILAVVPNKASVYPEYMNPSYPRSDAPGNAARLAARTRVARVPITDVLAAHADEGLYFHQDTHWNALGARRAARAILETLAAETGADIPLPDPAAPYETRVDWRSDLIRLLEPYTDACEGQQYFADRLPFAYSGRYRAPEDLTIRTTGGAAPLRLLVLRDSFTNQLLEDLSGAVEDVTYLRAMPLPLREAAGTDAVLLEIVERRLPELLAAPPEMPAPAATRPADLDAADMIDTRLEAARVEGEALVSGALAEAVPNLREVSLGVRTEDGEAWYSAFPVSGFAGDGDRGFAALLPALPEGAEICVYMRGDTALRSEWTRPDAAGD